MSATGRVKVKGNRWLRSGPSKSIKFMVVSIQCSVKVLKIMIKQETKKPSIDRRLLNCIVRNNYFLNFEYLFLNLSIRPAVSTNLDFPV
jgi:hypothetical protein